MTSETRTLSAFTNAVTLTYGYNLSGQLTSITDPFNGQVTYQRDNTGRVTSMGANGYVAWYHESNYNEGSMSVTQLASNIQYRAWGAVKQMTYGNGVGETTGFNQRLQPTAYSLSNVRFYNSFPYPNKASATMSWTFDYFDEGRANHAYDQSDHSYDRRWEYDHAARLSGAYTNHGARGEPDPNYADVYRQTIQYDVWGNITNRTGKIYAANHSDTATYVNNRRQDQYNPFTYDAEANVLTTTQNAHSFDAVGQQIKARSSAAVGNGTAQFPFQPAMELIEAYDGTGAPASHDELTRSENYELDGHGNPFLSSISSGEDISYYMRSTVLGGAVLAEFIRGAQGQPLKRRTSFYLNGQRIARDGGPFGSISYEHTNPINGSSVVTNGHPNWRAMTRQDRDPFGADLSLLSQEYSYWSAGGLYTESANPNDYIDGCFVDGVPINCNSWWLKGTVEPCPDRNCGPRVGKDGKLTQPFQAFADGWSGFLPVGAHYDGNGQWYLPEGGTDNALGKERKVRPEDGDYGTTFGGDLDLSEPQKTSGQRCDERLNGIFGGDGTAFATDRDPPSRYDNLRCSKMKKSGEIRRRSAKMG